MNTPLSRNWWAFAVRGVLAIGLGVLAFLVPGPTLAALITVFGAFSLVDGVFSIAGGVGGAGNPRWLMILSGIAGVVIGVYAFVSPGLTALALLTVIAVWAIVTGVAEIVAAIRMRDVIDREWVLVLSGVLSVLFGAFLLISPGSGILALVWLVGWYAILAGVMYLTLAFRLRGQTGRAREGFRGGALSGN